MVGESTYETNEVVDWLESLANWETFFTGTVAPNWYRRKDGTRDMSFITCQSLRKGFEHFMRSNFKIWRSSSPSLSAAISSAVSASKPSLVCLGAGLSVLPPSRSAMAAMLPYGLFNGVLPPPLGVFH